MRPLPSVRRDGASAAFFDAAAQGRLLLGRCPECATSYGPEVRSCASCGRPVEGQVAAGSASLVTWAVVHAAPLPVLADQVPYVCGVVELPEGPWLVARLDVETTALRAGFALQVAFVDAGEEMVPVFQAAEAV